MTPAPRGAPGRPAQPSPASYTTGELGEWLERGARSMGTAGHAAAVELLRRSPTWLRRRDWRELCVTVTGAQSGAPMAFVDWDAWATALRPAASPAAGGELAGRPALEATPSALTLYRVARWLWDDPCVLGRLDAPNTRSVLAAVTIACGHGELGVTGPGGGLAPV